MILVETPEVNLEAVASLSWRDTNGALHTVTFPFQLEANISDSQAEDLLHEVKEGVWSLYCDGEIGEEDDE